MENDYSKRFTITVGIFSGVVFKEVYISFYPNEIGLGIVSKVRTVLYIFSFSQNLE